MTTGRDYRSILRVRRFCKKYWNKDRHYRLFKKAYVSEYDTLKAAKYLKVVAERGDSYMQCLLGEVYCELEMYKEALEYFKLSAEQRNPVALCQIGNLYNFGRGVEMDNQIGFEYFKISADLGYDNAQYNVGLIYLRGKGVQKSYEKALEYFHLAAAQGYRDAQYYVGKHKFLGLGVTADRREAFELFRLACPRNYSYPAADSDLAEQIERLELQYSLRSYRSYDKVVKKNRRVRWLL